jgi:hypothetical protein
LGTNCDAHPESQLRPLVGLTPEARETRQTKAEQRRVIDDAIEQLLMLLSQRASHALLTEKVEALHRHIQSLFPKPSSKA